MKNLKLLITIAFCLLVSFAINAQDIDPNYYYRLTNSFLKEGRSLDTYSNGKNEPFMGKTGSYSGQMWKFTPTGNGYYRLTNAFLGDDRSLDTYSDGNNKPFMGKTGNYSGQYWKLTAVGNGYYRLTNSFLKEGRSLDTYSDGKNAPFMGKTGNYSGQMWKLTKLSKIKPVKEDIVEIKPQLDPNVKGTNVNMVEFNAGKSTGVFRQISLKKWGEYDAKGKKKFQFEETGRDEWSVYMIDKSRGGMRIALDLWQKKVKIDGKPYYGITKAKSLTNGTNINTVVFNDKGKTSSFKQTALKKWEEYDAAGKLKWKFEETHRDEWSIYLVDKSRDNMKIALDAWQKKVKIDGKPYYDITDASVVTNGLNVKTVNYEKGSFSQNGIKWHEFDASGKKKWSFDETGRDQWSVYLIDKTRGGMKIQLDLHTKNILIDGKATYKITESLR